jgi:UDP-N-acetylmuramyl pentapeptide phosphotransferase/UDP-N-acetylglucosamine-1-phosphate transferase
MADLNIFSIGLIAVAASLFAGLFIIFTEGFHGRFSMDDNMSGAQKFHKIPVPRVGGLALAFAFLVVIAFSALTANSLAAVNDSNNMFKLLLAGMPALIAGVWEVVTKAVSVAVRLLATFASALIACWLLGACLNRLDIWGFDVILQVAPIAIMLTAFAVAGVANSINIIDGFNGLAGSAAILILAGLGCVAWSAGDVFVVKLAIAGIGATIGFLILNYPTGRIFMGDGGAYLLGFWIAEVAILTIVRNPGINAWQILAICAYPVIEVLYSIYRKKVIRKMSPSLPDRLHFHMLVYRRFVCQYVPSSSVRPWSRNAMVTCVVIAWLAPMTVLSVYFGKTIPGAVTMIIVQVLLYLSLYARLVRGHWCLNPVVCFGFRKEQYGRAASNAKQSLHHG